MEDAILKYCKENPNANMGMPPASGPERMQQLERRCDRFEEIFLEMNERIEALEKKPVTKPKAAPKAKQADN